MVPGSGDLDKIIKSISFEIIEAQHDGKELHRNVPVCRRTQQRMKMRPPNCKNGEGGCRPSPPHGRISM
ncbi:hypothetical protein ACHAXS_008692 [Conticribra weissflogii]